mmetsp:Transcript_29945/g.79818  ORF Transcript_29945/g.79818 Transcript_29945/m.79818 type:complete len:220 (+) Transcript_29945:1529-2188(+)
MRRASLRNRGERPPAQCCSEHAMQTAEEVRCPNTARRALPRGGSDCEPPLSRGALSVSTRAGAPQSWLLLLLESNTAKSPYPALQSLTAAKRHWVLQANCRRHNVCNSETRQRAPRQSISRNASDTNNCLNYQVPPLAHRRYFRSNRCCHSFVCLHHCRHHRRPHHPVSVRGLANSRRTTAIAAQHEDWSYDPYQLRLARFPAALQLLPPTSTPQTTRQ